ncbi:uncharacterized protein UNK4.17-like [Mizuhopecten yessoensis]|uniref:Uncharacterized protein UNK4.17 n=1 Tax=Mizuhopecten yessoensis TaxID=6573 RepID=A0A210QCL9_MIZYE|nr:uncharacterized protein UNK4.17-like [Mizuhopecten yessoensis]OWF46461.1 Uncharacterized protein UNK4.17 [Mizuhopecten yessoensis]
MSKTTLRIGFVGAGNVNFGRWHVPWDHASRLERLGGIQVIGIVDPDTEKAEERLQTRLTSQHGHLYKDCRVMADLSNLIAMNPDAVFIGVPPMARGSLEPKKDLELQCVRAGIHVFMEKPMSVLPLDDFRFYAAAVQKAVVESKVVLSVGYMFRYHAAVIKMKELMREHGGKVMAFNARYYFAYTEMTNKYWYNADLSGGPIVEQATHFCDLARHIVGDVDLSTVHTLMLDADDRSGAGNIAHVPLGAEEDIPLRKRIPRVTMSHWRFEDGGIGTLMHSIALPGNRYEANIDVQMDGLKLSLLEPYRDTCILRVRSMEKGKRDEDKDFTFEGSDSYGTELKTFIEAVRSNDQSLIKSSYEDAVKTYELTWAIRLSGERNLRT